jgi:hypothetical protein
MRKKEGMIHLWKSPMIILALDWVQKPDFYMMLCQR